MARECGSSGMCPAYPPTYIYTLARNPKGKKPHNLETHQRTVAMLTHDCPPPSEMAREKMWSRIHLIPALQAEEDRDQVRRYWANQALEKELMGENTRVYHGDRFVPPTFSVVPAQPVPKK